MICGSFREEAKAVKGVVIPTNDFLDVNSSTARQLTDLDSIQKQLKKGLTRIRKRGQKKQQQSSEPVVKMPVHRLTLKDGTHVLYIVSTPHGSGNYL